MNLDQTVAALKKTYGAKIGFGKDIPPTRRIPTGSLALDIGLVGGWPIDKIITVAAKESAAKTASAFHAVRQCQSLFPDRQAAWIAKEPFDIGWARANGVDVDKLIVVEPELGEEAVDVFQALFHTKELSIIVLDSIGALAPATELEKEATNNQQGTRVKLVKKLVLKIEAGQAPTKEGKRSNTVILLLSHLYDTMDQYKPYVIAGGSALRRASSLILTYHKREYIWEGAKNETDPIGIRCSVKTEKDKTRGVVKPFDFQFFNRDGWNGDAKAGSFDDISTIITEGQLIPDPSEPLIKRTGAWYNFGENKLQGEERLWNFLASNPEEKEKLEKQIRHHYNI